MAEILGASMPSIPSFNLTGFFSGSFIYVLIVGIIGFILIITVAIILFMRTYNRRVIVFENVGGQGYVKSFNTMARIIKLGASGEEVLKCLAGGRYLPASSRKMSKNTYWFAKGSDGYFYNIVLGDLDTKNKMLDIEPIDRDVRNEHLFIDRMSYSKFGEKSMMEKLLPYILIVLFIGLFVFSMWLLLGKVGKSTAALSSTAATNQEVLKALENILNNPIMINYYKGNVTTGLIPAS
jgi:hypothetical protein